MSSPSFFTDRLSCCILVFFSLRRIIMHPKAILLLLLSFFYTGSGHRVRERRSLSNETSSPISLKEPMHSAESYISSTQLVPSVRQLAHHPHQQHHHHRSGYTTSPTPRATASTTASSLYNARVTHDNEESHPFFEEMSSSADNLTSLDSRQTVYLSEESRGDAPFLIYRGERGPDNMIIVKHQSHSTQSSQAPVIKLIDKPVYRDGNSRLRYVKKKLVPLKSLLPSPSRLNKSVRRHNGDHYTTRANYLNHYQQVEERYENSHSNIPGTPWVDYPLYSVVPFTGFSCKLTPFPGFYADIDAGCQVTFLDNFLSNCSLALQVIYLVFLILLFCRPGIIVNWMEDTTSFSVLMEPCSIRRLEYVTGGIMSTVHHPSGNTL